MEKLERYLDQVCRGLGGPRAMRQHVRQELREHLLDAVARHKEAGMADDAALERAFEEFGKADDVRTELEATHGYRMMAVVIDKAMQWKEMTMRAKWLWVTWATAALLLVIALEVMFITFNVLFIVPKFQKLRHDGIIDLGVGNESGVSWLFNFLWTVNHVAGNHTLLLLVAAVAAWGLFEWRVRSENKTFMRLSALGTVAVGLSIVFGLMVGALVIGFCLGAPATGRLVLPFAKEQVSTMEQALGGLDKAAAAKDWEAMPELTEKLSQALDRMTLAPVVPALTGWEGTNAMETLRGHIRTASGELPKTQEAIRAKDLTGLEASLRNLRKSYDPIRDAAKRVPR
jgi:hypothetical protein